MHRRFLQLFAAPTLALTAFAVRGSAQPAPPSDAGGGGGATTMPANPDGPPTGDDGGPRHGGGPDGIGGGPRGPWGGGFGGGDRGGFGGHGGGGPGGPMERHMPSMDVMRGYMELVDRYTRLSGDADAAGISAVLATNDLYRGKSDAAIAYFTRLLADVPRPAVKRAIRLQLIDLYKAAGKTDLAIEQLEILMKAPLDK